MNFLDEKEREDLQVKHRLERDRKICDRIKAILLFDKGWSCEQIAEALLLSDRTIKNHISEYKESKKLELGTKGSIEKLNARQSEQLIRHLEEHTYLYSKDILLYITSR